MASYTYYIPDPTNISSNITQLTNKINIDLEINATLNSINYDSLTQIMTVNFATALTKSEVIILIKLVDVNIFGLIPGIDINALMYNNENRDSISASSNPTANHDIGNFYVPGSIVINDTTNESFLCIKNNSGNAVWNKIDCPTITTNTDNTINLALDGTTYRLLEAPTGATGNYVLNVGSTGAYIFSPLNYSRNILGSTGATDPNGTTNPSDYSNPIAGDQYYDRTTGQNWIYNGTSWDYVIGGITGATGSRGRTGATGATGPSGVGTEFLSQLADVSIGVNCSHGITGMTPPYNGNILQYGYTGTTGSTGVTGMWYNVPGLWEDLRVPVTSTTVSSSRPPTFSRVLNTGITGSTGVSQGVFTWYFAYNTTVTSEQELYFSAQLPHSYEEGTNLYPHIHIIPGSNTSGTTRWGLEYTWSNVNSTFSATQIIYGNQTIATNSLNKHTILSFDLDSTNNPIDGITGVNQKISSMLLCRVFRNSSSPADNFASSIGLLEIDFHFMQCGNGSSQLFIK